MECFPVGDSLPFGGRGNVRPAEVRAFGPALTRFVPGRIGRGFTDDLQEVANELVEAGVTVVEHHHGLWYDRRRDDHTRVRRANGDVTPPFYEQPFARSGIGQAHDGLSKYDLGKFNPWYWMRLKRFADLCDESGLVLLHQHYFQHNLLEAGAHWTDFPWRSANNINDTGFPEPPPYAGDKRIFQAHLFYDPSHPRRRDLHRRYIRQCLENTAGNQNVIHSIGAEFTGPRSFVEFWIDTIVAWEGETGRDVLVSLSCTKDVQDAVLADPARAKAVSIIDIRYWWYTRDGELYAPAGGMNLSPRQHARRLKPQSPSAESKRRAVRGVPAEVSRQSGLVQRRAPRVTTRDLRLMSFRYDSLRGSVIFLSCMIGFQGLRAEAEQPRPHAEVGVLQLDEVKWTAGFWKDRVDTCHTRMIPSMWEIMKGTHYKPFYQHFEIAAGLAEGRHRGAKWNDGDFYKWMEAVCYMLAVEPDPDWERRLDEIIATIAKAQRKDGYIHTPVLIGARNGDESARPFSDRLAFEMYNMGHLITAACVHHQVTGRDNFLAVAKKSAEFPGRRLPEPHCRTSSPRNLPLALHGHRRSLSRDWRGEASRACQAPPEDAGVGGGRR